MGRRKIVIKRIENSEARHVTFSKRRGGLFKKLGELCIHCGAEAAALVYSPGGKVHVFAWPDEDSVFARFMQEAPRAAEGAGTAGADAESAAREARLRAACAEVRAVMDAEKAGQWWWEGVSPEALGLEELERLRNLVLELREAVEKAVSKEGPPAAAAPPIECMGMGMGMGMGLSAAACSSQLPARSR